MKDAQNICLNCDFKVDQALYCPNCGQKAASRNLSIKYFLTNSYIAFIDFDKRILRSLRDIWVPNKISIDFLAGGRSTYVNHLRFFLICLAVFFALIALNMRQLDLNNDKMEKVSMQKNILRQFQNYEKNTKNPCDSIWVDSLKMQLFSDLRSYSDSIPKVDNELLQLNFDSTESNIDIADAYNLSRDSIYTKYEIESKTMRYLVGQGIKMLKNSSGIAKFAVGNMFWGILMTIFIMALMFKLIFLGDHSFYVEHVMHLINFHCISMLLFSVLLLFDLFTTMPEWSYVLAAVFAIVHLNLSLKQYYDLTRLNTLFKSIIIGIAYMICLGIVVLLIFGVSFLFF